MSLIATLGLKPPKNKPLPATRSGAKSPASAAEAELLASMAVYAKALAEATAKASTPEQKAAVATAQQRLGELVKAADEARKSARALGDERDKEKLLGAATEKLKLKGREVLEKHLPRVLAGLDAVQAAQPKAEEDAPGWAKEGKSEDSAIIGKNKMGLGHAGKGSAGFKDAKGNEVKVEGKFGLKSWVAVAAKPLLDPPVYEVSFHAVFAVDASLAGKLKQGSGFELGGGKEIKISMKHELEGEQAKDRYVDCVRAGKPGAFPELQLAAALDQVRLDDLKSLVAAVNTLGGSVGGLRGMADGDETQIENTDKRNASAGFAGLFGLEAGTSKVGTVTRTVRRSGKKWEFEYLAVDLSADSAGVSGQSGAGIGMGGKASASEQRFVQVLVEVEESNARLQERLQQIAAADSLEALKALRASCKDLKFTFTQGKSSGTADEVDFKGGPAEIALQNSRGRGQTVSEDSDGNQVTTDTGRNERGGVASLLGQALFGDSREQNFQGAADQNNVGMGEVGQADKEFGLADAARELGNALLRKVGIDGGDGGIEPEQHLKGLELSDADYGKLAALAKKPDDWDHCGLFANNNKSYFLWKDLRQRVAGGKRASINAALADYQAADGNGMREVVRWALENGGSPQKAVEYEFPQPLVPFKDLYIGFVRFDPMDDIRDASDAARMRKKWTETVQQIGKLVALIHASSKQFHDPGLAIKMGQRLETVRKRVQAEGSKLLAEAEQDQSVEPPSAEQEELALRAQVRAELEERIRSLKRDIDSMHAVEQNDFQAWQEKLDGFRLVRSASDYLPLRNKLMKLQSDWRGLMRELKTLLEEAGPPYHPAEADAVRPDEDRYQSLVRRSGIR